MTINPFWAGVLVTIFIELALSISLIVWLGYKNMKK